MNGLPFYKAYPRDFLEGTAGMRFELKAAYRLVLDLIYMQGGRLPDDARYIAGHLGCSVRLWNKLRAELIEAGKIQTDGAVISNFRASFELESLVKHQDNQREKARKPRKNNELQQPRLSHTEPEPEPDISPNGDIPPVVPQGGQGREVEDLFGDEPDLSRQEAPKPKRSRRKSKTEDPERVELPEGWVPSPEDAAYAASLGMTPADIEDAGRDFAIYWRKERGSERRTPDGWAQTWRNRCRDVAPSYKRNHASGGPAGPGRGGGTSIASIVARRRMAGGI